MGYLRSPDWVDQAGPKLPEIHKGVSSESQHENFLSDTNIWCWKSGYHITAFTASHTFQQVNSVSIFILFTIFLPSSGPLFLGVLYLSCPGPGCVDCAVGARGPCFLSFLWFYFPPLIALVSLKTPSWTEPDHPPLPAESWGWGAVLAMVSIPAMKHHDRPGGLHF